MIIHSWAQGKWTRRECECNQNGIVAAGAGGFIDITSTAKNVEIFSVSTFTGGQIKVEFDECGIKILQEGRFRKLVKKVQQISYNGKMAVSRGQNMFYVTERAVFQLTEDGPMLIEIARGADLGGQEYTGQYGVSSADSQHIKETRYTYTEGPFG